jgi:hypothetical protein
MGFEPMNTGFADQRVSHFATGAHAAAGLNSTPALKKVYTNKNPTSLASAGGALEFRFVRTEPTLKNTPALCLTDSSWDMPG